MKKKVSVVLFLILFTTVILGLMYGVDMYRMNHNQPVVFFTWGYDYAPPVEPEEPSEHIPHLPEPPVLELTDQEGNVKAECLISTNDWSDGEKTLISDYTVHHNREFGEENILKCAGNLVEESFYFDPSYGEITRARLFRFGFNDPLKVRVSYTADSIMVPTPENEAYILEITMEYPQGTVNYCVKVVKE